MFENMTEQQARGKILKLVGYDYKYVYSHFGCNLKASDMQASIGCTQAVVRHVESNGIQTGMLFAGNLIKPPCFDEMKNSGKGFRVVGSLENTDRIMNDTFRVGVCPGITDEMIDYMATTIIEAGNENRF